MQLSARVFEDFGRNHSVGTKIPMGAVQDGLDACHRTAGQTKKSGRLPLSDNRPAELTFYIVDLFGFCKLLALFPQLHVLHLLAAITCQGFCHKGGAFLVAVLFLVLLRGKFVCSQVAFRQNFE